MRTSNCKYCQSETVGSIPACSTCAGLQVDAHHAKKADETAVAFVQAKEQGLVQYAVWKYVENSVPGLVEWRGFSIL